MTECASPASLPYMRTAISIVCGVVLVLCLVVLGPAITLWQTVLNPEFVTSRLDIVDAPALMADQLKQQLPQGTEWLEPVIDEATADMESWANEQVGVVATAATAYLKGEREFRAVISLTEFKSYLQTHLEELLSGLPLDELFNLPPGQTDMFLQVVGDQIATLAPDTLVIDESSLDTETLSALQTGRAYTATLRTVLTVVPIIAVLMALGIALVQRFRPRSTLRYLGIPLAIAGITCLILAFLIPSLVWGQVAGQLPPEVVPLVPGLVSECCTPLFIYSGALVLAGMAFVLLSFLLRPTEY